VADLINDLAANIVEDVAVNSSGGDADAVFHASASRLVRVSLEAHCRLLVGPGSVVRRDGQNIPSHHIGF
jgi:hypothetical protein